MNNCSFVGRLGRDPETKFFQDSSVTEFSIALDKGKNKDGTDRGAVWLTCKAWNKTGTLIADYFKKGQMIALQGSLDQEDWADKNTGEKRSKHVLLVNRLTFLGKGSDSAGAPPAQQASQACAEPNYDDFPF